MPYKFMLSDYTHDILKIAKANEGMSNARALECFISNLVTMKEHYEGCPHLNYHELGQQWNRLLSAEKVAQKNEVLKRLAAYSKVGGKH